jgi:hypothetical protein
MTTKLKIDISQGLLEVEGSEAFVRSIYVDFKTHFAGIEGEEKVKAIRRGRKAATKATPAPPKVTEAEAPPIPEPAVVLPEAPPPEPVVVAPVEGAPPALLPQPPRPEATASPYTYLKELELGPQPDHPSLVDFMDSKFPITNEERNIVFLYYLQHMLNIKPVTVDHIYTCYRVAKIRAPLNIEKALNQHDWIKIAKNGQLTLSSTGKGYVEKQLPKRHKN